MNNDAFPPLFINIFLLFKYLYLNANNLNLHRH